MPPTKTSSPIRLWTKNTCLLSTLVEELRLRPGDQQGLSTVVLPTRRLGNWLKAMLVKVSGKTTVLPRIQNFDDFLQGHTPWPETLEHVPRLISPLADELAVEHLINTSGYRQLRPAYAHEAVQFFNELVAWDIDSETAYGRLHEVLGGRVASASAEDSLKQRIHELQDLGARRRDLLDRYGLFNRTDKQKLMSASLAAAIEQHGSAGLWSGPLYLVGFTSFEAMHHKLLKALVQQANVQMWISEEPLRADTSQAARGPIGRLLQVILGLEGAAPVPEQGISARVESQHPSLLVVAAEDPLSEAVQAVQLMRQAIADGHAPHHAAIIVTDDQVYAAPLRLALAQSGIVANNALTEALATTASGAYIQTLAELLLHRDDPVAWMNLIAHPCSLVWLKHQHPELALQEPSVLTTNLQQALARQHKSSAAVSGLVADQAVAALRARISWFWQTPSSEAVAAAEQAGTRTDVAGLFASWCEEFLLAPLAEQQSQAKARGQQDQAARATAQALTGFISDLSNLDSRVTGPIDLRRLALLLQKDLLRRDVREVGDQLQTLQVLSMEEARYVPFSVAIIVGCNEGRLPRALPQDLLLDNFLKTRIGLPGWQLLEAIEDTSFRLLAARLDLLLLSHAHSDGQKVLVPSRFVDAPLAEGERLALSLSSLEPCVDQILFGPPRALAGADRGGLLRHEGKIPGGVESMLASLRTTEVETLLHCPYRFALQRLGVEPLAWDQDDDARVQGQWLHAVLEAFFTGYYRNTQGQRLPLPQGTPALPRQRPGQDEDFACSLVPRLVAISSLLAPDGMTDTPLFHHLVHYAWPAYARHVASIYDEPAWQRQGELGLREWSMGHAADVIVEVQGRVRRLRGRIDAVDVAGAQVLVTDYKRRGHADARAVTSGQAPQLLLYWRALMQHFASAADEAGRWRSAAAILGYWSLIDGTFTLTACGADAAEFARQRGWLKGRAQAKLDAAQSQLDALWRWRDQQVFDAQAFTADPNRCQECALAGVCRKDEPALSAAIAGRPGLKAWLNSQGSAATEDDDAV